ncbi:hypothetical protein G5C65_00260 [Streptomyces sp. SB3404]|uniref:Uncharacterized protein n=2 Tax=Streptomyces boncukensis TaxID=2711219 RepID=A0A6G4WNI2_9ACTN|nr:hypothetical protein [Streptomyces boncukensis]
MMTCTTSGVAVCSLKRDTDQIIQPGRYTIVHFPFGYRESYDVHAMHQVQQPDGYTITDWDRDDRSGLIWPSRSGWGQLHAMIQWEAGGYTELRDQFVRDALAFGPDPENTTATDHRTPTPGMQCFTKTHGIFVNPAVPLSLRVAHNDSRPRAMVLAEFKLVINDA